ncbi:hypothetical protein ANANG_G00201850 [Anguilla anguilla]|uniref:Uncharacterized protein n=1 Tax=Anguilla anguilla TaxID=7936 RepID=A0A9D3LY22_ANGAN|nr:hypothetical protein ANANG_G00201850 [Anguilla anguilla]
MDNRVLSSYCLEEIRGFPTGLVCFEPVALSLNAGRRNTWVADGEPATRVWGWKWTPGLGFGSSRHSVG